MTLPNHALLLMESAWHRWYQRTFFGICPDACLRARLTEWIQHFDDGGRSREMASEWAKMRLLKASPPTDRPLAYHWPDGTWVPVTDYSSDTHAFLGANFLLGLIPEHAE